MLPFDDDHIGRELLQLAGDDTRPVGVEHAPEKIDRNVLAKDPAQVLEPLEEGAGTSLSLRVLSGIEH